MSDAMTVQSSPAAETLAVLVMALGPGSPCFCCGYPLEICLAAKPVAVTSGAVPALLSCPQCGAGVSLEPGSALTSTLPWHQR